ncbi:hypothetical protein PPAR_a0756 [Pseudoalteromonas paragorgicola KMM 3548]|nr:hypothetical protein [Pseudoalteromonas distincta KMM 3548]
MLGHKKTRNMCGFFNYLLYLIKAIKKARLLCLQCLPL